MSPGSPPQEPGRRPYSPPRPAAGQLPTRTAGSGPRPRTAARLPIPRSQRWLFGIMLVLVVAMSAYLIRLRERASDRFAAAAEPLPLTVADTHEEPLRLYLANDMDGSLVEKPIVFPLPADPNARARVVLEKLLEEYAAPGSHHPLHTPAGVEEVYLLPVPGLHAPGSQLAVVNLSPAFVQNHPSGIEPETLTLLSMIATLRANLPAVAQVRFLVEGQQQATLAGHADLTHAYLAAATQMAPGEDPAAGTSEEPGPRP